MADISNLSQFLTDVATAIREKKGTEGQIPAANFDTEIKSIETGGSGDVKLFETVEEMQADSAAKEGDLAIVYRNEIQNMAANTQTQYMTFPETVTLPEAFTGNAHCTLRAVDEAATFFDGQMRLSQTSFDFTGYADSGMIRVRYRSNDGITYTRIRFEGNDGELVNPVDFGTIVKVYAPEEWNDNLGYFMQLGGSTFDGLYECKIVDNYNRVKCLDIAQSNTTDRIFSQDFITLPDVKLDDGTTNYAVLISTIENNIAKDYTIYKSNGPIELAFNNDATLKFISAYSNFNGEEYTLIVEEYVDNILQSTVTHSPSENPLPPVYSSSQAHGYDKIVTSGYFYNGNDGIMKFASKSTELPFDGTTSRVGIQVTYSYEPKLAYQITPNQFTLATPNQLLPGISAYGRNGSIVGNDTIWDNVPSDVILNRLVNKQSDITFARTKDALDMNVSDMMWISKDSDIQVNPIMTSNYPDIKQSFTDNGITLNSEVTFTEAKYIGAVIGEQRDKYVLTGGSYYTIYDIKTDTWYANKLPNDIVPNNSSKVMYTNKYMYIVYSTDVKEQNGITRMNLESKELSAQTILEILEYPSQLNYEYGSLVLDISETYGYIFNGKNGVIVNFNSGETKTITDSYKMIGLFAIPNTNDVIYLVPTSSNQKQYLCKRLTNTGTISKTYTCSTSGDVTVDFYNKHIRFIGLNNDIIHVIFDMIERTVFSLEYDINADAFKYANTIEHDSGDYIMYGVSEYFNATEFVSDRGIKFSVNYNDHTIQEQKVASKNKYDTISNINGLDMENELLFAGNCLLLKATNTSMTVMQYEPLFYKTDNVLSQEEYNTALTTTEQILGEEVTENE